MPRFKISKNQEQFDLLISLLDRSDKSSESSWDLIQMLATNQDLYKRVMLLKTAQDPQTGKIEWSKFFDSNSVYKLLYTLQIVEAVMEEGEGEGLESVSIVTDDDYAKKKNVPTPPPLIGPMPPGMSIQTEEIELKKEDSEKKDPVPQDLQQPSLIKRQSTVVTNQDEDKKLKSEWTKMFLENSGFEYILKIFMEKEIKLSDETLSTNAHFELKHIAFLLKLLRIFIMAAFSTAADASVFDQAILARRSSNVDDD